MVSSEDGKGLRHNPRHKDAFVFGADSTEYRRVNPEFSYLRKWGVRLGDSDLRVQTILDKLYSVWPSFSPEDRELYLRTAESIAAAERAKAEWNPKAIRNRYTRLSASAVEAAKLAKQLSVLFPPPWTGDRAPIGALIESLGSFIEGAVHATYPEEVALASGVAAAFVRSTKQRLKRKRRKIHWELLRDLVWLASHKTCEPDERTVRRYLNEQPYVKHLAYDCWKKNWGMLVGALRLVPQHDGTLFEKESRTYLNDLLPNS